MYTALAWFGNTQTADRDSTLGYDSILMFTYLLHKNLSLDFGADYARINDSVSGYSQGVISSTSFNEAKGSVRNKTALFARLQLEF